ncbi:hypothetical protein AB1Y20_023537 [Prymnesium parvum]|uniref:Uncharacterized protein n=1 Tax=Prymnesium parvum TaxID=97485 RepID=A0AB34JFR5_PRYPA|mmetsp:Transcript_20839/g.31071  ORF Transcript_20839/g.31071 Transcript_20839/m.31071 type:complete len:209 (+) Transcript_20839:10-636(+)
MFSLAKRAPLRFAVAYGGAKTIAADVLVQKYLEKQEHIDGRRAGVFLLFGLVQVGFVQYMLYVKAFAWLFPTAASFATSPLAAKLRDPVGLRNVAKQVALDQFAYHPLIYFPVFYTFKEVVQGDSKSVQELVGRAMSQYLPNAIDDLKALWSIFVPVSIIQFSLMPMHLRVPFTATAGFIWCGVLSFMRGDGSQSVLKLRAVGQEYKT